jgi:hypothetical protein
MNVDDDERVVAIESVGESDEPGEPGDSEPPSASPEGELDAGSEDGASFGGEGGADDAS